MITWAADLEARLGIAARLQSRDSTRHRGAELKFQPLGHRGRGPKSRGLFSVT